MKRIDAEHLVDAYALTIGLFGGKDAMNSLREVILDSMTGEIICPYTKTSYCPYKSNLWQYPNVTFKTSTTKADNG